MLERGVARTVCWSGSWGEPLTGPFADSCCSSPMRRLMLSVLRMLDLRSSWLLLLGG
jgi:hypothetical protein